MEGSPERAYLTDLDARLDDGEAEDADTALALLAGRDVELDEGELRGARRRAVELLAAGGDPTRTPDPEGRAVTALAADLDRPERRAALAAGFRSLRTAAGGLPRVSGLLEDLAADEQRAWRCFALALLAEELLAEEEL